MDCEGDTDPDTTLFCFISGALATAKPYRCGSFVLICWLDPRFNRCDGFNTQTLRSVHSQSPEHSECGVRGEGGGTETAQQRGAE